MIVRAAALAAVAACLASPAAFAQSDDEVDFEIRIERLENQIRQLTGQNEELQFRNRQLEEQLRALQAGQPAQASAPRAPAASYQPPPVQQPAVAAPPMQPPPVVTATPAPVSAPVAGGGRRGDAFDPNANPNAPGVPRALGGGMPVVEAPAGRAASAPMPPPAATAPPPAASAGLTTAPPAQTPRDEFDLGIGYIQRRDYALAEETMRNFAQKYPGDPLVADSQYWLGESLYQRQRYRDAAEAFLGVTTKYESSAKAPDALLRLGQSLAALKEKEAACAAFGEVSRKYPRASAGVKQGVAREQKRLGC